MVALRRGDPMSKGFTLANFVVFAAQDERTVVSSASPGRVRRQ
jgi:hypothetical protein